MATKQITDLTLATSFDAGDLLLLRKTGEGVDKAITQQTFIQTFGNPSVTGFVATSTVANQVVLTPSNNVVVDKYYDEMVVTFISPITSTGAVSIQIAGLALKLMCELGGSTTSTLTTGKYYTAVYKLSANTFYQTNLVVPYIFTNEYIAVGTVQAGDLATKYALTTAIGTPKTVTGYYPGMAALFTTDIASKGDLILNIDGLGEKSLQDPEGDEVPNDLLAKEAITAIYDGTVFRKRMFSQLEPVDPIDPPADILVYVGASRALTTATLALSQLINDYGENGGGRSAVIQLDSGYSLNGLNVTRSTPWITIKTDAGGNNCDTIYITGTGNINFQGIFNYTNATATNKFLYINSAGSIGLIKPRCTFTNSTINNTQGAVQNACVFMESGQGQPNNPVYFKNVNVTGFTRLLSDGSYAVTGGAGNFLYEDGTAVMRGEGSYGYQPITSSGTVTLNNINFGTLPVFLTSTFISSGSINMNGVTATMSTGINQPMVDIRYISNSISTLTNCTFYSPATMVTAPTVQSGAALIIDGGDFRRGSSGSSPDIVAQDYTGAVIRLRNNPVGTNQAIGKGKIITEV